MQRIRDVDLIETRVEALRRDPAYHMSRWTPDQRAAAVSLYKLHQENPRFQGELKTYASLQRRLPSIEHPNYLSEGQIYSLLDALHETPDV